MRTSHNTDPQWAMGANKARRFQDYVGAILVIGGNAIGLGAVIKIYSERMGENVVIVWITAGVALISLIALLLIPRWSYTPE